MSTPTQKLTSPERRAAIIDAASRMFSERGFRGTTTRELAAAVGVSEPVLYQHFETKQELYSAIIDSKSRIGMENVADSLEPYLDGDDDRGFFAKVAEMILDWYAKDPACIRLLLFSALEGHELADLFFERYSVAFFATIHGYVERRIRQDAFRRMDPALIIRAFTGMIGNYGMSCVVFHEPPLAGPRGAAIEDMVSIFLKGLRNE